ncbi:L-hydantoinase [compost metagenome]
MRWDHLIKNGTIVTPRDMYRAHIYVKDGRISSISEHLLEGEAAMETDAEGLYVLPGLIDTHVHSRDPGATHKEDFYHSTQAAAAGGITTIFEMPNTNPPLDSKANFESQVKNLQAKAFVNFGLWGICLGKANLHDLRELDEAGVIGFKYFWGYAIQRNPFQLVYNHTGDGSDLIPPCHDGEVLEIFEEVAKTGKVLAIHAENHELIQTLTERVRASGRSDYAALVESRPNLAEELTVQTGIALARATGARLHILHVSTAEAVDVIAAAQQAGVQVTAETCPQYLFLTDQDYERIGTAMKIYPLVKHQQDQDRIWQGVQDGVIRIVCSDHAPHTEKEKAGDLWSVPAGSCGVETIVPLMLNEVSRGRLTLQQMAALLSENPARQYGLYPRKGALQIGSDADLTLVDMNRKVELRAEQLHSKTKVSAFSGFRVQGFPAATIVGGRLVMKDGQIVGDPAGQLVVPDLK